MSDRAKNAAFQPALPGEDEEGTFQNLLHLTQGSSTLEVPGPLGMLSSIEPEALRAYRAPRPRKTRDE